MEENGKNEGFDITIEELEQDYLSAKNVHDETLDRISNALSIRDCTGSFSHKKVAGRSAVQPKLVKKNNAWRYSSLEDPFLNSIDIFSVEPTTYEDIEPAKIASILLDYHFRMKLKFRRIINVMSRKLVDEGVVFLKTSWNSIEKDVEVKTPVFQYSQASEDQFNAMQQEANGLPEHSIDESIKESLSKSNELGFPVIASISGYETHIEKKLVENHPFLEVCDTNAVVPDPTCKGVIEDAKFIFHKYETCYSDLKSTGIYKNLDEIVYTVDEDDSQSNTGYYFRDKPRKKFTVKEYWGFIDIDDSGIVQPVVISYVGYVKIREDINPYPDGELPFVFISYMQDEEGFSSSTDAELLEDNQRIVGGLTRGILDIFGRSANGQRGIDESLITSNAELKKFRAGEDFRFVSDGNPIEARMASFKYPELPVSVFNFMDQQQNNADAMTGVKSFSGGISGQALGDVATSVKGVLDSTSKRELSILRRMSDGLCEVAKKFLSMSGEFLNDEEVLRISSKEFKSFHREALTKDFDISIKIETAEIVQSKKENLSFLLQTLGNNMPFEFTKIVLEKIAEVGKMPDLEEKIAQYQPQPDPAEEKLKELGIKKAEMEIAKLEAEIAQITQGKIPEHQAKAEKATSEADLLDLEFVETESGVTHERDVEKIATQAKEQTKMKIAEQKAKLSGAMDKND